MDFATIDNLILQCASGVAPSTMAAIIRVESAGNPWAIGDNTTRKRVSRNPKSAEEAAAIAIDLINKGHNLDLGLSQINSANLKAYKVSVREIFDPCTNIKVGSSILSNFYIKSVKKYGVGEKSLFHALSAYNTGSFYKGPKYVSKILKAAGSTASISNIAWKQSTKTSQYINNNSENKKNKIYDMKSAPILSFSYAESESLDGQMIRANEILAITE